MPGKSKPPAEGDTESQLATQIRNSANQIWLAGLGAFAKAQGEGVKVFDALVKEGEAVQERAKRAADDRISEARASAMGTWEKLEKVFEDRVQRALHSLNVPTKSDIDKLSRRVAELTAVTKRLSAEMGEAKAPTRRAKSAKTARSRSTYETA